MRFFFLGADGADNATVRDFAVSGHLVALDEEDGVGSLGNASTNAIGESTKFVCKRLGPHFCGVAGDLAGDEVTVFVALASDLVDDGISLVLSWEALDITWQESSQCVTEQCRSVRPSVTCVSSVLAFAHARSHSFETTTSHLFYNQQFGATIRLSATTRRAIPTLYGVLPTV
jgi:hypothetical protein